MVHFLLVRFTVNKEGDIVPENWVEKCQSKCFWPPSGTPLKKIQTLVKKGCKPAKNFVSWEIKLLSNKRYSTFTQAEKAFQEKEKAFEEVAIATDDETMKLKRFSAEEPLDDFRLNTPFNEDSNLSSNDDADDEDNGIVDERQSDAEKSEASNVEKPEASNVEKPEALNVEKPEALNVEKPEALNVEKSEASKAKQPEPNKFELAAAFGEISKVGESVEELKLILINEILPNLTGNESYDTKVIDDMTPLASMDEVAVFDKKLKEEQDFRKLAVKWIIGNGGKTSKLMMARTLERLLTPEVGEKFSLEGRKKKESFSALEIYKVLKVAAKTRLKSLYDEENLEDGVRNYLKRAPEGSIATETVRAKKPRKVQVKMPFYFDVVPSITEVIAETSKSKDASEDVAEMVTESITETVSESEGSNTQ